MVTRYNFPKIVGFVIANSADPYEMTLYMAFHLGLHRFQKKTLMGFIQNNFNLIGFSCPIIFSWIFDTPSTFLLKSVSSITEKSITGLDKKNF